VAEAVAVQSASRLLTRRTLERLKAIATGETAPATTDTVQADGVEQELQGKPKKSAPKKKASRKK